MWKYWILARISIFLILYSLHSLMISVSATQQWASLYKSLSWSFRWFIILSQYSVNLPLHQGKGSTSLSSAPVQLITKSPLSCLISIVTTLSDHADMLHKSSSAVLFPSSRLPSFFPEALDLYLSMPHLPAAPTPPNLSPESQLLLSLTCIIAADAFVCLICLTLHHWFGIELFWRGILPHSSADEHTGGQRFLWIEFLKRKLIFYRCFLFRWIVLKWILGAPQAL